MLVELDKRLKELEAKVAELQSSVDALGDEVIDRDTNSSVRDRLEPPCPHKARTRALPTETLTAVSEEIIGPDGKLTASEPVVTRTGLEPLKDDFGEVYFCPPADIPHDSENEEY